MGRLHLPTRIDRCRRGQMKPAHDLLETRRAIAMIFLIQPTFADSYYLARKLIWHTPIQVATSAFICIGMPLLILAIDWKDIRGLPLLEQIAAGLFFAFVFTIAWTTGFTALVARAITKVMLKGGDARRLEVSRENIALVTPQKRFDHPWSTISHVRAGPHGVLFLGSRRADVVFLPMRSIRSASEFEEIKNLVREKGLKLT